MYRAFNLSLSELPHTMRDVFKKGSQLKNDHLKLLETALGDFADEGRPLDGSEIQNQWFPRIDADVFISHSHRDSRLALSLAGWLSTTFGLTPFVDSSVWSHADTMQRKIDDQFCLNSEKSMYDYTLRNKSTAHVHAMLTSALAEMIENTECLIFLNTPESVSAEDAIDRTWSPWIYTELSMTRIIRRKPAASHRGMAKIGESVEFSAKPAIPIRYIAPLESLTALGDHYLLLWRLTYNIGSLTAPGQHPLDALYELIPEKR
jgi:hypothetical protein